MKQKQRLILSATLALVAMTSLGCKSISVQTDCSWAIPISWSDADTEETKIEIYKHNLKYEDICLGNN